MFLIETNSGKSIRDYSHFEQEDEILLPPGRYLKVIDQSSPAKDLYIIHLREIQPPYPMLPNPLPNQSSSQKKQEQNLTTNVVSKPAVQASSNKGRSPYFIKFDTFVMKHTYSESELYASPVPMLMLPVLRRSWLCDYKYDC
jgi:hypothetical protein